MAVSENQLDCSPARISQLVSELRSEMTHAIDDIGDINDQTKIISINAKITANKAGDAGKAFSVVADEVMRLSDRTATVAHSLSSETNASIIELEDISRMLETNVKGDTLSIYASTNIDLIDRNLYERSCDVRWWATDKSLTDVLVNPSDQGFAYASERLGVILSAYTVYYDLVLADMNGVIVANGRPDLYRSTGKSVADQSWFQDAIASGSGDEYFEQSVHESDLVNGQRSLIYSCGVRENGLANGTLLGALGIVFNWDGLAQDIVEKTPISSEEWPITRVCIVDQNGRVMADTAGKQLSETLSFRKCDQVLSNNTGFLETEISGTKMRVAHSPSKGFETYLSGWVSVIFQKSSRR